MILGETFQNLSLTEMHFLILQHFFKLELWNRNSFVMICNQIKIDFSNVRLIISPLTQTYLYVTVKNVANIRKIMLHYQKC